MTQRRDSPPRNAASNDPVQAELWTDSPELATECSTLASELGLKVAIEVLENPLAAPQGPAQGPWGVALVSAPSIGELIQLADARRGSGWRTALALLQRSGEEDALLELASDLGLYAVDETKPLIAILALLTAGATRPWAASRKGLSAIDQLRFSSVCNGNEKRLGGLQSEDPLWIAYKTGADAGTGPNKVRLGAPEHVVAAIAAIRTTAEIQPPPSETPEPLAEVSEVLWGPARTLSDPASKRALAFFGMPFPDEQLCSSPSRSATEAQRIGFPVRVTLASPDLRTWEHPELSEDFVDTAAGVREVYRHQVSLAQTLDPTARILGTVVAATAPTQALLRGQLTPIRAEGTGSAGTGQTLLEIGFADPHGLASGDRTQTILPQTGPGLERVLSRLAGSPLVLSGTTTQRRTIVEGLQSLLASAHRLVTSHEEVDGVTLEPIALLPGGTWEVREACVEITDVFERSLEHPA